MPQFPMSRARPEIAVVMRDGMIVVSPTLSEIRVHNDSIANDPALTFHPTAAELDALIFALQSLRNTNLP